MANRNKPHNYRSQVGETFSSWTVIDDSVRKHGRVHWLCRCVCGTERIVSAQTVRNGKSTSCGCSRGACYTLNGHTANQKTTPEYASWGAMRSRCSNPNHAAYKYYGGRGITVCEAWNASFEAFLADMGNCPEGKETIDRIDVNLGYQPGNCRWASMKEQAQNRRWGAPKVSRKRDSLGRYA